MLLEVPPALLAAMVGLGVPAVIALSALGREGRPRLLGNLDEAVDRLRLDVDDVRLADGVVADDGRAALLALEDGRNALVLVMGHRLTTRLLDGLRDVRDDGDGLVLRFADAGLPAARVVLADAGSRATWRERLEARRAAA